MPLTSKHLKFCLNTQILMRDHVFCLKMLSNKLFANDSYPITTTF